MYNGIINVYKEEGFTSHDVVAKLRGILRQKKIGHTGTLDPDAVGVLPVCLGSGTKLSDMLTDRSKEYRAVLLLGKVTDTQDVSGKVLSEKEVIITHGQAEEIILSFVGEYDQIPPMYSAVKIDGRKLYQLAREGKEIERRARKVQIHKIEIEKIELPEVTMRIECSKGTYIRTLCHDIGSLSGCGGVMKSLVRTRAGEFKIEEAIRLTEIEELVRKDRLNEWILPVEDIFIEYKAITVLRDFQKLIDNGNAVSGDMTSKSCRVKQGEQVRIYNEDGRFYGIYKYFEEDNRFKPVKMFMENE